MKKYLAIIIIAIIFSGNVSVHGQFQNNADYFIRFIVDRDVDDMVIAPMCRNNTKDEIALRYTLERRKINKGRIDKKCICQSGIFILLPKEEKAACRMDVKISRKDGYQIDFYLYRNGSRVGTYSISGQPSL